MPDQLDLPGSFGNNRQLSNPVKSMKLITTIALLVFCSLARASLLPDNSLEYVSDYAGLLSHSRINDLSDRLYAFDLSYDRELIVVTINSYAEYSADFDSWESLARAWFRHWEVGKRGRGILLLVAREGRKIRIQLGSRYGHRYDPVMQQIIDEQIYPAFREDRFAEGISAGVDAIMQATRIRDPDIQTIPWPIQLILGGIMLMLLLGSVDISARPGYISIMTAVILLYIVGNVYLFSLGWSIALFVLIMFVVWFNTTKNRGSGSDDSFADTGDNSWGGDSDGGGASGGD